MLRQLYDFEHALENFFGHEFHFYDIPSVILVLVVVIMIIVHLIKSKKRKDKFEKEIEEHLEEMRAHENEDENGNDKYFNIPDIEE